MPTRRRLIQHTGWLCAGLVMGCDAKNNATPQAHWLMPEEGEPHQRTWMAFGASAKIWGQRLLPQVQRDLATLARTIAQFEPVTLLVRPQETALAKRLVGDEVEIVTTPLDDLWLRDTGPVFVRDPAGNKAAVDFNFNGWGNKQAHQKDTKVARFIAAQAGVPVIGTDLVLEGGGIEVDGQGTAIITESCTLNRNRNPGISKAQFEDRLMPLLGLEKIIWLPGIKGRDITDGHTDFYARFARPGVVIAGLDPDPSSFDHDVTQQHQELLAAATDARGQRLKLVPLEAPQYIRPQHDSRDFAAGYVGFYLCNGAVIMQQFGDRAADDAARQALESVFPERRIEQINIDAIAAGGGSIHCATQQEPAA